MPLPPTFLAEFCRDTFGRTPEKVTPVRGLGFVNEVYRAEFGDSRMILRFRVGAGAYREFRKEAFCMGQAQALGIPTAEVLALGLYGETAYLAESCVAGINGSLCPEKADFIWETLGDYARRLHTAPVAGYGPELSDGNRFFNSFSPTLQAHLQYNLACLGANDPLIQLGVYAVSNMGMLRTAFSELLGMELPTGLIHGDLSLKNTIVGDRVYLIDYGCAFVGVVPDEELISAGESPGASLPAFLRGYGIRDERHCQSKPFLSLSAVSAFDKLRWALVHDAADKPRYLDTAKKQAALLLDSLR